jgi:hypothetical protein
MSARFGVIETHVDMLSLAMERFEPLRGLVNFGDGELSGTSSDQRYRGDFSGSIGRSARKLYPYLHDFCS